MIVSSDLLDKNHEIHHCLLDCEIDVMLWREGEFRWEGVGDSKVTVFTKNDQAFCFLCDSFGHEARVFIESVNIPFIASVEQNWACGGVPVSIID